MVRCREGPSSITKTRAYLHDEVSPTFFRVNLASCCDQSVIGGTNRLDAVQLVPLASVESTSTFQSGTCMGSNGFKYSRFIVYEATGLICSKDVTRSRGYQWMQA